MAGWAAILPAAGTRWTGRNVVLLLLAIGLVGAFGLAFVGASPNRILSPKPLSLLAAARARQCSAWLAAGLALFVVGVASRERRLAGLAVLAGAAVIFVGVFITAGDAATTLVRAATNPGARVSFGAGFWVIALTSALAMAEAMNRLGVPSRPRLSLRPAHRRDHRRLRRRRLVRRSFDRARVGEPARGIRRRVGCSTFSWWSSRSSSRF